MALLEEIADERRLAAGPAGAIETLKRLRSRRGFEAARVAGLFSANARALRS